MNIARRLAAPVPVLQLTNITELVQFWQIAARSKLVPPEYRGQPESIMLAVQLGSELGLSPMQSIQNILARRMVRLGHPWHIA